MNLNRPDPAPVRRTQFRRISDAMAAAIGTAFRRITGTIGGSLKSACTILGVCATMVAAPAWAGDRVDVYVDYGQTVNYSDTITCSGGIYSGSEDGRGAPPDGISVDLEEDDGECTATFTGTVSGYTSGSYDEWFYYYNSGTSQVYRFYVYNALSLSGATLSSGMNSVSYSSSAVSASGGSGDYSYSLSDGSLPDGLELDDDTGKISGKPTEEGDFTFKVTVKDTGVVATQPTKTASFSITIEPGIPTVEDSSDTVDANTEKNKLDLDISGADATGITIKSSPSHGTVTTSGAKIYYTPTAGYSGSDSLTYKAYNANGTSDDTAKVSITVTPPILAITPTSLGEAQVAVAYSTTLSASLGTASYTYAVTSGTLPKGLELSPAGVLSGTPTYADTYDFTVTATDVYGATGDQDYSITVKQADLTLTPSPLDEGTIAIAYSVQLGVSGGYGPYTVELTKGDLPDGITYDASSKMLAGMPTVFGTYALTFALADNSNSSASVEVDLVISDLPDPTKDAEVIGLVKAQVTTVRRFAKQQMTNVNGHLSQLHKRGDGGLTSSFGAGVSYNSDSRETASSRAPGEEGAPAVGGFVATHGDAADDQGFADAFKQFTKGRAAVWTAGSVDFGSRELGGNDSEMDHVSLALSAGIDYAVTKSLVAGLAIGVNRAHTTVTDNGTKTDGEGASLTGYASWQVAPNVYLDGLAGYGLLSFDNTRYVTSTGDFATGDRDGQQTFAAITATYEGELAGFDLAPYARVQASRSWLDSYTESGGGAYDLYYGDQTVDSFTGAFGLTVARTFLRSEGSFAPRLKLEYGHEFGEASDMMLTYLASPTVYSLSGDDEQKDYGTVGLGLDLMTVDKATKLALDYAISFDADGIRNQPISFKFSHAF